MDIHSLVAGGGITGVLGALAYSAKLALDWYRTHKDEPRIENAAQVSDAATANAVLSQTLHDLHAENQRLTDRVKALEDELAEKERKLDELEIKVRALSNELGQVTDELAALRAH